MELQVGLLLICRGIVTVRLVDAGAAVEDLHAVYVLRPGCDKNLGTYHVISRIVAGERLLKERDKEVLRKQIWRMAGFCGVEVFTYCILSNHFGLLATFPRRETSPTRSWSAGMPFFMARNKRGSCGRTFNRRDYAPGCEARF